MLKGHVFKEQIFGNQIFALFINTFLNGQNGVSNNYKNGMQVTYSSSTLTVQSGAVCVQGRFLEEDTSTDISAGTDSSYCKLVIEIDLDKQNTEGQLSQASYKIVKSSSGYPNLTQNDIVKNNAGIYQYELARFKTSLSGITEFQDMRTFLDFNSIYSVIQTQFQSVLDELEEELASVEDGSAYVLKNDFTTKHILLDNTNVRVELIKIGNLCIINAYSKSTLSSSYFWKFDIPENLKPSNPSFILHYSPTVDANFNIDGYSVLTSERFEVQNKTNTHKYFFNTISYYLE